MAFIYINGVFYEDSEAKISVKDRGFRFGDGVFETVSFTDNKLYRWDLHKQRLDGGLNAIKIEFNSERLESDILKTIARNNLTSGLARITITRGEGSHGYLPNKGNVANVVIEAMPQPPIERESVKLCVSSYKKIPPECLPVQYKINQGLNSTLAKMEAIEKGCFDALLLNMNDEITECTSSNIFWVKGEKIYTPAIECGLLDGTIRHVLMENRKITEGKYKLKDLKDADEVFITNAAMKIMPVDEIDGVWKNKKGYGLTKHLKRSIDDN